MTDRIRTCTPRVEISYAAVKHHCHMATPVGFEPTTECFEGTNSKSAELRSHVFGTEGGIRTHKSDQAPQCLRLLRKPFRHSGMLMAPAPGVSGPFVLSDSRFTADSTRPKSLCMVAYVGLEPTSTSLKGSPLDPLHYTPCCVGRPRRNRTFLNVIISHAPSTSTVRSRMFGEPSRDRTCDTGGKNPVLYR